MKLFNCLDRGASLSKAVNYDLWFGQGKGGDLAKFELMVGYSVGY